MTRNDDRATLSGAVRTWRGAFAGTAVIGALVNVLYLTGSFFMLEVYDRVLPSRSVPTLIGLAVLALVLYAFQGALEALRGRLLARIGTALDAQMSPRVLDAVIRRPLKEPMTGDGLLPLRDLDQVRSFLSGTGPQALFDLPWMPLYLGICFLFHPAIGVAALAGALLLIALTWLTNAFTKAPAEATVAHGQVRNVLAEAGRRNAEVITAMGMGPRLSEIWGRANRDYMAAQLRVADVAGGLGGLSKVSRMVLQSAVLGLGAYLVIEGQATAGIMIASSILTARALAPAELAIANWKGYVAARQSWTRLTALLERIPPETQPLTLPAPTASVTVEGVSVGPPGATRPMVLEATFGLRAGQAVGVIGPSASGKSTLARAVVGVWTPLRGTVRLDGAALGQWTAATLGPHVGYLPQEAELFAGTIAENIARFTADPPPASIIAAARAAGVHEMILRLSQGYDTPIGEGGAGLSAGQRQRIGLARALYGDPFLVVLDEPNANLDAEGEGALTQAILGVRARGGVAMVVAHRPSALAAVDLVLVMAEGRIQAFGPRDEILKRVLRSADAPSPTGVTEPASASAPRLQESA